MSGFIEGDDRSQATLFPERLDDYVAEDNPTDAEQTQRYQEFIAQGKSQI